MTQVINNIKQKLYRFEVDQSIRIEKLNEASIIAVANVEQAYTVIISIRVKHRLQEIYRRQGQPKLFAPQVFAAVIAFSLKQSNLKAHEIIIDIEYPGYEQEIMRLINKLHPNLSVYFTSIGKKSPAHFAAYGVYIKRRKGDISASTKNILQITKNDPRTVTPPDKAGRFAAHIEPSTKHNKNY